MSKRVLMMAEIIMDHEIEFLNEDGFFDGEYITYRFDPSPEEYRQLMTYLNSVQQ